MIRKFRKWLWDKFLPAWAKESLLEDNKRLLQCNAELKAQLNEARAYIDGMERVLRRRLTIHNEVVKK